jgi:protein TonB
LTPGQILKYNPYYAQSEITETPYEESSEESNDSIADEPSTIDEDKVFDVVDIMPQFPGGGSALIEYLALSVKYPVVAEENGIQGRVVCTVVIEKDGSVNEVKVVRSVDPSLDKEAIRVLRSMPRWIPGENNGMPCRVKYTLPVTFKLQ